MMLIGIQGSLRQLEAKKHPHEAGVWFEHQTARTIEDKN